MADILVTSPFQPFTLPTQFKAVFNGYIYCGTVDAVDPSVSQVQVYLVNEEGDKVPVVQPLRTNAGGLLVYNGQPAKFVTSSNHSLLVRDSLGSQLWYAPDVSKADPDAVATIIGSQAREALRRSYAEAGYNLVDGSFDTGGTLVNANDVLLQERTGKAFSGPAGIVAPGTDPTSGGFVDKSLTNFSSVQDLLNSGITLSVGDVVWSGATKWVATAAPSGPALGGVYIKPVDGFVSLADCRVVFDGVTDNAAAIDYAANLGLPVRLSFGYSATSGLHVFNRAVTGVGSRLCGFVNLDTSASKGHLITIQNTSEACYGFSVDGSASATQNTKNQDPAAWSSSNYDTWYGARGILFKNCPGIPVSDVRGLNSARFSGIRAENSDDAVFSFCHTKRSRGNFGDGFYHVGCAGVKYNFCTSWDTTRIGFVSEGNATTSKISNNIKYNSCSAGYAHDGSINYGGTEYAVGFWAENTDNVDYSMCSADAVEHAGFIWAPTTPSNAAVVSRAATYVQCGVNGADFGFMATPFSSAAKNEAIYSACRTSAITSQSYLCRPGSGFKISATYKSCHAGQSGAGTNCIAFSPETGAAGSHVSMTIDDCTTSWADISRLTDAAANAADISQFAATGTAEITVRSLRNETTGTVYAKVRQTTSAGYNFTLDGVAGVLTSQSGGKVKIRRSAVSGDIKASLFRLDDLTVPASQTLKLTNGEVYGNARLVDSILWITHELGKMPETQRILGELSVEVEKDIAATDYALRLQFEQTIKPTFVVSGNFYNSGATAAADKNFIWAVRTGTKLLTKGAINDNTVPNIYRINTATGNFAVGQQNVIMH